MPLVSVRYGSLADITTAMELVRFVPHKQKRSYGESAKNQRQNKKTEP